MKDDTNHYTLFIFVRSSYYLINNQQSTTTTIIYNQHIPAFLNKYWSCIDHLMDLSASLDKYDSRRAAFSSNMFDRYFFHWDEVQWFNFVEWFNLGGPGDGWDDFDLGEEQMEPPQNAAGSPGSHLWSFTPLVTPRRPWNKKIFWSAWVLPGQFWCNILI